MSVVATPIRPPVRPASLLAGAIGCVLLAGWGLFMPRGVLQGWLIAFVIAGGPPLGAVALVCKARLTGGRWALAKSALLSRAIAATPLVGLTFLPVLLGIGLIFPWVRNSDAPGKDVAEYYLNTDFFALRGGLALIGLSVVALLLTSGRGRRLLAAVGLVFYAVAIDVTSFDWMLSLEPRFSSSAFGAGNGDPANPLRPRADARRPWFEQRGDRARYRWPDARRRARGALHGNDVADY